MDPQATRTFEFHFYKNLLLFHVYLVLFKGENKKKVKQFTANSWPFIMEIKYKIVKSRAIHGITDVKLTSAIIFPNCFDKKVNHHETFGH